MHARYTALRELLGYDRVPLVYQTPSGYGLRVVYRIPRLPLAELVEGARKGLVADVLRAAGLPPKFGTLEIHPQPRLADRLPLGRRMPLLDPEDLAPLGWAAIGDTFDAELLQQALAEIEDWYDKPDSPLVDHLRRLPRRSLAEASTEPATRYTNPLRRVASEPPDSSQRLASDGLTQRRSRYDAEWEMGSALLKWPTWFTDYNLGAAPSDAEVAYALATWLADHSNGLSEEWNDTLRASGSREQAIREWQKRYLNKGADGRSMIDRMRTAAMLSDPGLRLVAELSECDALTILDWGTDNYEASANRYRFECWAWSAFRWLKAKCLKDARRGKLVPHSAYEGDLPMVDYDVPARTMERWPFGGGRSSRTGSPRYVEYAKILKRIGWMKWQSGYFNPRRFNPKLPDDIKGKARTFTFPLPELSIRAKELPVRPGMLDQILTKIDPRMGEPISRGEAYHALFVVNRVPDLGGRYKRATADRIRKIASDIQRLAREQPHET